MRAPEWRALLNSTRQQYPMIDERQLRIVQMENSLQYPMAMTDGGDRLSKSEVRCSRSVPTRYIQFEDE